MAEKTDKLKLEGVFTKGYGTIPKLVMQDEELTIEAKGIYAYLSSYAGAGETAFPSVNLIMRDLGIGDNRFYKHRKLLVERGYIKIERERLDNGFSKNVYTICSVVHRQNNGIRDTTVHRQNEDLRNDDLQNDDLQNDGTNNNRSNNNRSNNNSTNKDNNNNGSENKNSKSENKNPKPEKKNTKEVHQFYQDNFGIESQYISQELEYLVEDLNVELVLEAMKRAKEYGAEFGYAKKILKRWVNKNIDSMEKVGQADVEFERKTNKKYKQKSSKKKPDEKLPDWANQEQDTSKDDEVIDDSNTESRLERLRRLREEKGVANE